MRSRAQRERGPGSQFCKDRQMMGYALRAPEEWFLPDDMPDPMPAHTANGTRVYLHWHPLRWERHP